MKEQLAQELALLEGKRQVIRKGALTLLRFRALVSFSSNTLLMKLMEDCVSYRSNEDLYPSGK